MRVLITTEFYYPQLTGVVTAVVNQKKALEMLGYEVRILTIGDVKDSYYDAKDGAYYIKRVKWQPYPDSYVSFAYNDKLVKEIIEWHPDVVHAQCEFFTLSFAKKIAKKCKAPLFETCHTDFDEYYMHFTKNKKLWDRIVPKVVRSRMKPIQKIVCPTKKIFDMLDRYEVKNDKVVIPVGMDLDKYHQHLSSEERVDLRSKYGINADDFVFVSVCRVSPEKNISESIRYFNELLKLRKDIKLLIVGDGTDLENLKNLVKELKLEESVKFTGLVDFSIIWKYFKLGDVFVSASTSEIQGLTYIEALACGVPLLCRADQALDGTLDLGNNGYSYTSVENYLEKACFLIDNPLKLKGLADNTINSVTKYGLEAFSNSLDKIYSEKRKGEKN